MFLVKIIPYCRLKRQKPYPISDCPSTLDLVVVVVFQTKTAKTEKKTELKHTFIRGKLIYGDLIYTSSCLVRCWLTSESHLGLASCLLYRNFLFNHRISCLDTISPTGSRVQSSCCYISSQFSNILFRFGYLLSKSMAPCFVLLLSNIVMYNCFTRM